MTLPLTGGTKARTFACDFAHLSELARAISLMSESALPLFQKQSFGLSCSMPFPPQTRSRLGLLLYPEICLLGGVAGILTMRHPEPGLTLLILVWLMDWPRTRSICKTAAYIGAFAFFLVYAGWRNPEPPPVPDWLRAAAYPARNAEGESRPAGAVRIRAQVASCTLLQGDRARVLLQGAEPVQEAGTAYSGLIVWNWRAPDFMPLPGEVLEVSLRFSDLRGLANPGVWDIDVYWHDRNVWFRAWTSGRAGPVIVEEGSLPHRLRRVLRERLYANLPRKDAHTADIAPAAAILPALLFGDRSQIGHGQSELFAKATLAHSLALSGLHLGFAVLAGATAAQAAGRVSPRLWLRVPRPTLTILLSLPFAAFYLWLGQMPVSLIRAFCMLGFWAILVLLKRPRVLLDGLFAAILVILLSNPLSLFDLGFQLSVLSVAAIALTLPGITRATECLFPGRKHRGLPGSILRGGMLLLGTSLCIQVALLPLTLKAFGASGLLFPLNLLWLPVLGVVVLPLSFLGLLLSAVGFDAAAGATLWMAALPCEALMALLTYLENVNLLAAPLMPRPRWLSMAGYWLLCLTLPALGRSLFHRVAGPAGKAPRSGLQEVWPEVGPGGGTGTAVFAGCALVMLLLPVFQTFLENGRTAVAVRLLDVGQGQAVLVEWRGMGGAAPSGRVLVDGGGFPGSSFDVGKAVIAPVLTDNSLPALHTVIATHPDADHLSGLLFILEHFSIGSYFSNGDAPRSVLAAREQAALRKNGGLAKKVLAAGDRLELAPGLHMEVLWPPPDMRFGSGGSKKEESGNDASLVLRLVWMGEPLALLCGDAENRALQGLLQSAHERVAARVLVLPHHGSEKSLAPGFYEGVKPKLALVSCGYGNRWGFPAGAVKKALREMGVPLYSTSEHGQIAVSWTHPEAAPALSFAVKR